jgi:flagellar hook-associated protein 1 FlgK
MSLFNTLYTGQSGMEAASRGIDATSHNVANALTPGYHRRGVDQSLSDPIQQSGLWIGTGVEVNAIARSADQLLGTQIVAQTGVAGAAATLQSDLSVVEAWFDETSVPAARLSLSAFFDALNESTIDPSNSSLRQAVLQTADNLAGKINDTHQALQDTAGLFDDRLQATVSTVNSQLGEIARLNEAIVTGGGALENGDLADQRDLLLGVVANSAGTTAHFEADGSATVFVGGHAIVSGNEARSLKLETPLGGTPRLLVSADDGQVLANDSIGGVIAGHLDARAAVDGYGDQLDGFATTFADAINTQHTAGFDRTGAAGLNLFSYDPTNAAASMQLNTALANQPDLLAFAADPAALAGDGINLAAMMSIETQALFGTNTASDYLSALTSTVGADIKDAGDSAMREGAILADLNELNHNLHGVDMDEEATNLIMYQTAYQAAAKVVTVTDNLMGTLLGLVR